MAPRVLLVEDDADLRALSGEALRRAGFEVVGVATGREALAALDDRPDVVVLDWNVPAPCGDELLRTLAERGAFRGIVIVSGEPPEALPIPVVEARVEMLRKPYRPYELIAVCLELLGPRTSRGD